ncbi:hypothetical protein ACKVMT_06840 [Halobacteriales archaeon Cl-PHB]
MAVSRHSGQRRPVDRTPYSLDGLPSPSRYDLQLAAIPVAILLSVVARTVLGVSSPLAVLPLGIVGSAVLVDALFVNPPKTVENEAAGERSAAG